MKYSIKALQAQHKRVQAKRAALFVKAYELSSALNEAFGAGIYASSADRMLDQIEPGEGTYGRLAYDGEELRVIYRTTEEDLEDQANGVPEDQRGYYIRPLSSCSPKWLDRLLEAESVDSCSRASAVCCTNGRRRSISRSARSISFSRLNRQRLRQE